MVGALGRSFFHRLLLCVSPVCLFACMFVRSMFDPCASTPQHHNQTPKDAVLARAPQS